MKSKLAIAISAAAFALVVVPAAFAQDYCVNDAACVSGGGTAESTLQAALSAADATPALDRVLLGTGTYTAPTTTGFRSISPVDIVGQGPGDTILTGPTDTGLVLYPGAGSHVANLEILIPQETTVPTKTGLELDNSLGENLQIAEAATPVTVTIGATLWDGSTMQDSDVYLPSPSQATVGVDLEQSATAQRNHLLGRVGIDFHGSDTHAIRDAVYADSTGASVVNSATNVDLTDSVLWMTGASTGVSVSTGNGTDAGIAVRGCTVIGDGTPASHGVWSSSNTSHAATVQIDSTIIRGFGYSLARAAGLGSADLTIAYSDFDPGKTYSGSGAGAISQGAGNVNVDPQFVSSLDLHLAASSALVDAGNPADLGDATDFAGNTRVTDGNGDGVARRDIGAYELPGKPAPQAGGSSAPAPAGVPPAAGDPAGSTVGTAALDRTAPVISHIHRSGRRLAFRLSERANVVLRIGKRVVKHRYARGNDSLALSRLLAGPGKYTLKLLAIDAAGNRSRTHRLYLIVR